MLAAPAAATGVEFAPNLTSQAAFEAPNCKPPNVFMLVVASITAFKRLCNKNPQLEHLKTWFLRVLALLPAAHLCNTKQNSERDSSERVRNGNEKLHSCFQPLKIKSLNHVLPKVQSTQFIATNE